MNSPDDPADGLAGGHAREDREMTTDELTAAIAAVDRFRAKRDDESRIAVATALLPLRGAWLIVGKSRYRSIMVGDMLSFYEEEVDSDDVVERIPF